MALYIESCCLMLACVCVKKVNEEPKKANVGIYFHICTFITGFYVVKWDYKFHFISWLSKAGKKSKKPGKKVKSREKK